MHLVLQFPVADLRKFLDGELGVLDRPVWGMPGPNEFVRSFGPIRVRGREGVPGWPAAARVCQIDNLISFVAGQQLPPLPWNPSVRHFFFDGEAVGCFEFAFSANKWSWCRTLTGTETVNMLHNFLALRVKVRRPQDEPYVTSLGTIGRQLAGAYLRSSTRHKMTADIQPWWVESGAPLLLLVTDPLENVASNPQARFVFRSPNLEVSHFWLPHSGADFSVWVLRQTHFAQEDDPLIRPIRLKLARLHTEREVLGVVLRAIATGRLQPKRGTDTSDKLQNYLNEATRTLQRLQSSSRSNHRTSKRSRTALDLAGSDEMLAFIEQERIRRQQDDQRAAQIATEADRFIFSTTDSGMRQQLQIRLDALDIRNNIKKKVRDVFKSQEEQRSSSRLIEQDFADVGLITVIDIEREMLHRVLGRVRELPLDDDGVHYFYEASVNTIRGRKLKVVTVKALAQGNLAATNAAQALIKRWSPRAIVLVGIAGGVHKEVGIGDVVVSNQILYYEMAKFRNGEASRRLDAYDPAAMLVAAADSIVSPKAAWIKAARKSLPPERALPPPKRIVGAIGSGDKVIADANAEEVQYLRNLNDKVRAVEMEAAGVANVIRGMRKELAPEFVTVRGISDHINEPEKTDEFHRYAAHAAASFTISLLRKLSY